MSVSVIIRECLDVERHLLYKQSQLKLKIKHNTGSVLVDEEDDDDDDDDDNDDDDDDEDDGDDGGGSGGGKWTTRPQSQTATT